VQGAQIAQGFSSNGSLFALLTGLRVNSPFVSVVMTVRLPVRSLDAAILDRYGMESTVIIYYLVCGRRHFVVHIHFSLLYHL